MSNHNPWFRLYTEAVDDEKLRLLAFEDRWHFIALLCCKGSGVLDGADSESLFRRKVAVKLGLQVRELDEVARRLAEVDLIDEQTLQPLAWCKRQFRSDNDKTATDRKRRQREREKQNIHLASVTDMSRVTSRVTVTNVTRTDTDTETEEDSLSVVTDLGARIQGNESKLPSCPHSEIIALYHSTLPELPRIVLARWPGSTDAKALASRWREDQRHQDMAFWDRFFRSVRDNPHWMGNNDRGWQANLRWLVQRKNFDKAVEAMATARRRAHG